MRRPAIIASILTLLLACDKQTEVVPDFSSTPQTEFSETSTILFQIYGSRDGPRAAPLAILDGGTLKPISLNSAGWHRFDSLFFSPGAHLPIYRNGIEAGTVEIVRGMWPVPGEPLYSLPSCRDLVPQAETRLQATVPTEESVELLGSSRPLAQRVDSRVLPRDASSLGRTLISAVVAASDIGQEEIGHLEFISRWLRTGVGPSGRTLLSTYIDPEAGDAGPGAGLTAMVLVLAEDSAGTLATSFKHVSTGAARSVEFQRVVNHLDLDGDGLDEIVIETWKYAQVPDLSVLKYADGKWVESFRVNLNWCVGTTGTDASP